MVRMPVLLSALVAVPGCLYATADVRYAKHPELTSVRLATGSRRIPPPPNLGLVRARAVSWTSCDDAVGQAMRDLLADARAMGGTGVADTRFLGRFTWIDRPVCRITPFTLWLRKATEAQGVAVK